MLIPGHLSHLDVEPKRALPIPYVQVRLPDGTPDFTAVDGNKTLLCGLKRLCGICEKPLEYWIVFLGGPASASSRSYVDPPMHETCARFATNACPYIANSNMKRRKNPLTEAIQTPGFGLDRPAEWVLYFTRDYKMSVNGQALTFRPAPFHHLETVGS